MFPDKTKAFLQFWQIQIDTGKCRHAPGSIGAAAHDLVEKGYLLHSRKTVVNYYDHEQPTRYKEVQGRPGTDGYLRAMMSPRYLEWLKGLQ